MADPATRSYRWSRDAYDRAVQAGILGPGDRIELIDGEILTMTPQGSRHAAVAARAAGRLARAFGGGCHVRTQMPLAAGGHSEPEPDVAVVEGDEFVRRLRPWSGNVRRRLVRAPRTYVRDSGIVHALLGLSGLDELLGHPVAGPSWEGFAVENLVSAAGPSRIPCYYRTQNGAEIDMVFERGVVVEMAIEIKRSPAAPLSRGFHAACDVLEPREKYLVHGGSARWPRPAGVTAIGLLELTEHLAATR